MDRSYIPAGNNYVMPYLIVNNATAFIDFLQTVFDATERSRHLQDSSGIMHAEVLIGDSVIMLADATEKYPPSPAGMFVYVPDADLTYKKALENGSLSVLEMNDQPYGRTGGVKDPFGNTWWITTDKSLGS